MGRDRPPAIPWRDTLIYELHVKGFSAFTRGAVGLAR